LSSTSQIDKAFLYRFLWPWLGSGLLTSTGMVIEQHSAAGSTVTERQCTNLSMVIQTHSPFVSKVNEQIFTTVIW
jgi:hypothetical protein